MRNLSTLLGSQLFAVLCNKRASSAAVIELVETRLITRRIMLNFWRLGFAQKIFQNTSILPWHR